MNLERRNAAAVAIVALAIWFMLVGVSFYAVLSIQDPWHAVDYWLAWFSGLSLAASITCAVAFGVNLYVYLGGR